MCKDHKVALERRGSPRLSAIENEIILSWSGHDPPHRSRGQIVNASATGVLVCSDELPPANQTVSVRLDRPIRTDWCETMVVRYCQGNLVGLRFAGCDPFAFTLGATMGIDIERSLLGMPDEQRFSHIDD